MSGCLNVWYGGYGEVWGDMGYVLVRVAARCLNRAEVVWAKGQRRSGGVDWPRLSSIEPFFTSTINSMYNIDAMISVLCRRSQYKVSDSTQNARDSLAGRSST